MPSDTDLKALTKRVREIRGQAQARAILAGFEDPNDTESRGGGDE